AIGGLRAYCDSCVPDVVRLTDSNVMCRIAISSSRAWSAGSGFVAAIESEAIDDAGGPDLRINGSGGRWCLSPMLELAVDLDPPVIGEVVVESGAGGEDFCSRPQVYQVSEEVSAVVIDLAAPEE